ncbi:MAG: glucosidase, partial [Cyanobacteria bacterium J06650_10]
NKLLFGEENESDYVKDGINDYVVRSHKAVVNPDEIGTKFAAQYKLSIPAGESRTVVLRLCNSGELENPFDESAMALFDQRKQEADEFYDSFAPDTISDDARMVQRQAFAGMLWSKQFYYYVVRDWLKGDPTQPAPPAGRESVRNTEWRHLFNDDIISMPDKWEYPWYASWDWPFHLIQFAVIDPDFAKLQLARVTREWYMHPNGQIPAYEWNFNDVTPPVQAWGAWQIYQLEKKYWGREDKDFLERIFQKLLLNFTWWVNQKDANGRNVFQGGFLGMDNIGVFDRSSELPTGGTLEQADATSWMAMYSLGLMTIALELAVDRPPYEDTASKFFEHFLYISNAISQQDGPSLWDEEDGFFYDAITFSDGDREMLRVRSLVGLIPILAVAPIKAELIDKLPDFKKRLQWFINNREDLKKNVACMETTGMGERRLLALCYATELSSGEKNKLTRLLEYMLDEAEFLSPYGIRSVSKYHKENPFALEVDNEEYKVKYQPAESDSNMFGGNSNWRGPIWFPINYLLLDALESFYAYLGDDFQLEYPTGSGKKKNLNEIRILLSERMNSIFFKDEAGRRPVYGDTEKFQTDPHWRDYILFYEYFHGDNGAGLGASHQTGWTGLVAHMIQQCGERSQQD